MIAGSILGIKPILTFNEKGGLSVAKKIKGRKAAARFLAQEVIDNVRKLDEYEIYVLDADDEENGNRIRDMIKEALPNANIVRQPVGPVIGTHCGPGTVATVYYGDKRIIPLAK
jgi:fatty acid-binding protein DegV